MFDRRRALVGTTKHGRMISLGSVLTLVAVFTAGAQEGRHCAAAVGTVDPAALGAELEFGEFRLRSDMADGGKQLRCVDAIAWGGGASVLGFMMVNPMVNLRACDEGIRG